MTEFDLTPDPKVLIALTHTPLQPLDALCELIDNAIDSFNAAKLQGSPIEFPLVVVELPGTAEINRGEGAVRVRDNGPGLTADLAEKALRAGYSGNRPYDSLGLFGMGFNISSGKIGRVTRFMTARKEDTDALEVVVDLIALQEQRNYKVPVKTITKPAEFSHGTVVEVRGWWPEGNPNAGAHSISNLTWLILQKRWADALEDSAEDIKEDIRGLFDAIRGRLPALVRDKAEDLFEDLTESQKKTMVSRMLGRNLDISKLGQKKSTGEYLPYVDEETVVEIFRRMPGIFFDGGVWTLAYAGITDLPENVLREAQNRIVAKHMNCLEDCYGFLNYDAPENLISQRARASVDFLLQGLG